jgi:hypothetical protein
MLSECWKASIPQEYADESCPILVYERFEMCGIVPIYTWLNLLEREAL